MNPVPFNTSKGNYLCIEVQENAYDFAINGSTLEWFKTTGGTYCFRDLPPGSWEIVSPLKDISDACMINILDEIIRPNEPVYYKNYMQNSFDEDRDWEGSTNIKKSFQSLCKSKGIDTDKNYIILKQTA